MLRFQLPAVSNGCARNLSVSYLLAVLISNPRKSVVGQVVYGVSRFAIRELGHVH